MMSGICGFLNDSLDHININLVEMMPTWCQLSGMQRRSWLQIQYVVGFRIRSPWHHLVVVRIGKVFTQNTLWRSLLDKHKWLLHIRLWFSLTVHYLEHKLGRVPRVWPLTYLQPCRDRMARFLSCQLCPNIQGSDLLWHIYNVSICTRITGIGVCNAYFVQWSSSLKGKH